MIQGEVLNERDASLLQVIGHLCTVPRGLAGLPERKRSRCGCDWVEGWIFV